MPTLDDLLSLVDQSRDEVIALTQALVRVPSVNIGVMPTGNETPACEVLRDKLAADGIAADILESASNRGNLVARWRGERSGPSLMLMGHVDVVPVEDETQWTHPPFSGDVADGRIWGRGSADMKSTVAAEAMAMILLKRLGVPLAGDLVLAAGADEEAGGAYGFSWLAANHPDKIRTDFAINEGGGRPLNRDGRLTYPINTGEKGRLEVTITVTGRGYHASAPWMADNAIYRAQPVLDRLAAYQPEVSAEGDLFCHLGDALGIAGQITNDNVDLIIADVSERDVDLGSWLRAASRMTIVATMIRAGVKSNSVAETCRITCDVRTLPWQDERYVSHQLDTILAGLDNVRYEITTTAIPSASAYDSPLAAHVQRATRRALGRDDLRFFPGLTTGFTDSRLVRPLGTIAYGFTPSHPESDPSLDGAHNINESASIDDAMVMTRMFAALAWDLLAHEG
jgi:acetylornithine deacetylase/succinyl-diaminopimelate desuccinylase-like protein